MNFTLAVAMSLVTLQFAAEGPELTGQAHDPPAAAPVSTAKAANKDAPADDRRATLRKSIALEEHLLELAQRKADQAEAARATLDEQMQKQIIENPSSLPAVWKQVSQAEKQAEEARGDVGQIQQRLNTLRGELAGAQDAHIAALTGAGPNNGPAEPAPGTFRLSQDFFTMENVVQWFLDHGPKLLGIVIGTFILSIFVRIGGRHLAQVVAKSGSRGTADDRTNRALTLVGVFRNTASLVLLTVALLMMLDEVGIPIGPLMGGAAVLGLAVAFGAQNLIRDYFSGFMVLLEDQYGINDVVRIDDVGGSVEKITLRMTVLRDLEGALHFVPHGSITRVTNMTHGWSRALLDVGVAYKEDADRVMQVLTEIGKQLRADPQFGPMILDGPEMLGLDNLGDSSVVIKFFVKTQPLQRWPVKRELLRRIKHRFDELGIEIPFPQRTVHIRSDDDEEATPAAAPLTPKAGR